MTTMKEVHNEERTVTWMASTTTVGDTERKIKNQLREKIAVCEGVSIQLQ